MLNGPIDKRTRPLVARKSEEHRIQAIIGRTWSARNKDTSIHLQKRTNKRRLWYYLLFCRLYSTCTFRIKTNTVPRYVDKFHTCSTEELRMLVVAVTMRFIRRKSGGRESLTGFLARALSPRSGLFPSMQFGC